MVRGLSGSGLSVAIILEKPGVMKQEETGGPEPAMKHCQTAPVWNGLCFYNRDWKKQGQNEDYQP